MQSRQLSLFAFLVENTLIPRDLITGFGETIMVACMQMHEMPGVPGHPCLHDHVQAPPLRSVLDTETMTNSSSLSDLASVAEDVDEELFLTPNESLNAEVTSPVVLGSLVEFLVLLLENGYLPLAAQCDYPDQVSPLHWASRGNCDVCVRQLLKYGHNIDLIAGDGATPLIHAAYLGNHSILNYLVAQGANLKIRTSNVSAFTLSHGNMNCTAIDYASRIFECADRFCYCHDQARVANREGKAQCQAILTKALKTVPSLQELCHRLLRKRHTIDTLHNFALPIPPTIGYEILIK